MADVLERITIALSDRYTIEREIGSGSMAVVYLADDLKQHRQVAVKVLRPDLAAALGAERFLREIEIAAKLSHPGILTLIDSGTDDGLLYYVMPFVEGESLRDRLNREKHLPIDDALQITREVAEALSSAHGQGVVHRDIKPENILLQAGHAVVADFGIAQAVTTAGGAQLTESGIAVATAAYMSPEQASAEDELDARSDIYSLGCVLYEMLAGETPYTGPSDQAILARKSLDPVPPLRHVRETVPLGVEQAVTRALAKVPADRYTTAQHFVEALAKPGVKEVRPTTRRAVRNLAGAVLALAIALGLWQGLGRNSDTTLDPNLVAVMPFRAAGADPSLGYLREGMMDLLAYKLTGEGGLRAAAPRTVMAAWRGVTSGAEADLSEKQAAGVARTIGAGQLLLGSVVGSPSHLVLSATLTSDGSTSSTQATVEGPEDSLPGMLDRLTAELLAGSAGERGVLRASLTTRSLDALKAYLDGHVAFRAGQYRVAGRHFSRALGADSAFSTAALFLLRTGGWGGHVPDGERVAEIAWDGRHRLGRQNRVLLEAYFGPQGPGDGSSSETLKARESAVTALPDQADAWFLLGEMYYHVAGFLGYRDWLERAAQAFEQAVALAPTWRAPLRHLTEVATDIGDTTEIRRLWQALVQLDSTRPPDDRVRYTTAVSLHDEEMIADALDRLAAAVPGLAGMALLPAQMSRGGEGAQYLDTLIAIMLSRLNQSDGWPWARYPVAMNQGRPRKALGLISSQVPEDSDWHLLRALYWNGVLVDTALVLWRADSAARAPFGPTAAEQRSQLVTACRLALWRLAHGETQSVTFLLQRLEAGLTMGDSVVPEGASPLCSSTIRAMLAAWQGRSDAMALVERVDSILWLGSQSDYGNKPVLHLIVAGLFEELGEPERALGALGVGQYFLSATLREEGRLAALTGDRERAIRAYSHYLKLRSDPEPEVLPEVQAVRAELARLVGEPE